MQPRLVREYHVFLASPSDMNEQRKEARRFFDYYNRNIAYRSNIRFTVVDWENYSTIGIGRPQELITAQTLERFKDSLVVMVGLMGQRFGRPTGERESGTEEEFYWALKSNQETGFPEIKWFFKNIERFEASSSDPAEIREELDQWIKVRAFRESLEKNKPPIFYQSFSDVSDFSEKFREDLSRWLSDERRPWQLLSDTSQRLSSGNVNIPDEYFESVVNDLKTLDIAGIDNDRVVDIPLSEVYVRLRVIRDEDSNSDEDVIEAEPIDIHDALGKYKHLVIVGDPGSGKSTFLKFIALMLARARVENDPGLASAKLNLQFPLPVPFFISLWDLSDSLKHKKQAGETAIVDFAVEQLAERGLTISRQELEGMLESGSCCVLFDGLDEVPTEQGRAVISRLVEKFVSRFSQNRFIVTSRVRGYTGDAILKGGFIRCDIQDFNETDRQEFLKNWFAALLRIDRSTVLAEGTASLEAYDTLRNAIEGKDRIRVLAVNPLLMTVIAIVHWNRKRLPDQRVDLYDECIDVLLGQRKTAERGGRYKDDGVFDAALEEEVQYDRAWTRKRFAEIALRILESGSDEITRDVLLNLLQQRFRDRPGSNDERAALEAERFLDRQELRSGLLSRRSHSCRFVHLTFQEYLAAWNLSNLSMMGITTTTWPHLRDPQWFETLQLLGGELAKVSDEKLDQFASYLLDNLGDTLRAQAPIIALCANILQDVKDVADVAPQTQERYLSALRGTLDAFRLDSGVPAKPQLEVLSALIPLGASVKEHLIQATKSSHYAVRTQAVSTLVHHLPDDDLFAMSHILKDRSQEPVLAYLKAMFERDRARALRLLSTADLSGTKAAKAIVMLWWHFHDALNRSDIMLVFKRALADSSKGSLWDIAYSLCSRPIIWDAVGDEVLGWTRDANDVLRERTVTLMTYVWRMRREKMDLLYKFAVDDPASNVRAEAIRNISMYSDFAESRGFLQQRAQEDPDESVRTEVLELLFSKFKSYQSPHYERYLLTTDFMWSQFRDPQVPISHEWAVKCSEVFGIPVTDIEKVFRRLAQELPITLAF